MKTQNTWFGFILKEWLLLISASGLVFTSVYLKRPPSYSIPELQVLFILFVLFVSVKGLENSGLILKLSQRIESGQFIPLKLIITTFFLSMMVTNDVALTIIVPLTLLLKIGRKNILVILEALAANAGSALTPFGNPQNLFIYWFYGIHPKEFIISIAPFSLIFLVLLVIAALFIKTTNIQATTLKIKKLRYSAYVYAVLLILVILTVFRVLPILAGVLVVFYAFLFDRKSLRVDFALLVSFFCFFGLANNMKILLATDIEHSAHVFLFSAVSSQIMSNVPVALLFAKFTTQWKALLWGTNVGGYGSLLGSLANLIAYKLYIAQENTNHLVTFTAMFLILGYVAFFIGIGLYFAMIRIL